MKSIGGYGGGKFKAYKREWGGRLEEYKGKGEMPEGYSGEMTGTVYGSGRKLMEESLG